ncbi:hypothetical protein BCR42DRAFT_451667 [Absidia repens]|uniref:Uncharacterized protein n=1 Tax=Absidia repens TaxID=90262 RepID=A0A1X2IFP4_9FUNG|nr:hypothetical protein BCR42DRAFT_451667 [Absidia repens]
MATAGQSVFLQSDAILTQPAANRRLLINKFLHLFRTLAAVLLCLTLLFDPQALFNQQVPTPFRILAAVLLYLTLLFDSKAFFNQQAPTPFSNLMRGWPEVIGTKGYIVSLHQRATSVKRYDGNDLERITPKIHSCTNDGDCPFKLRLAVLSFPSNLPLQ